MTFGCLLISGSLNQSSLSTCGRGTVPVAEPAQAAQARDIPDLSFAASAVQAALTGPAWRGLWVLPLHHLWLRDCQCCGFWKASRSSDLSSDRRAFYALKGVVEDTTALLSSQPTEGVFLGTTGAARLARPVLRLHIAMAHAVRPPASRAQGTGRTPLPPVSSLRFRNINNSLFLTLSGKLTRNS